MHAAPSSAAPPTAGKRPLLAAALLGTALLSNAASALTLLDTFSPGTTYLEERYSLSRNSVGAGTSLALPFSVTTQTTIDTILAAVEALPPANAGSLTLGIMDSAAGLPSDAFLHGVVLDNPSGIVALTGLGWSLAAGDYWLAAVGSNGFVGGWHWGAPGGVGRFATDTSFDDLPGWQTSPALLLPSARITTAVPEPTGAAMLLLGLGIVGVGVGIRHRLSAGPA